MERCALHVSLLSYFAYAVPRHNFDGSDVPQRSLQQPVAQTSRWTGELLLNASELGETFDGIGAISGGGATSRLLIDYVEPQRSQILDYLFKPNFGASLQLLKVEIGGDSQSTNGVESSHMHTRDTLDLETGYEWWIMQEAKKRNPDIKLYGLPWTFPGWVATDPVTGEVQMTTTAGDGRKQGSPFAYPEQTSRYVVEWVKGAKNRYGLHIDYVGIWNERSTGRMSRYVTTLRRMLDDAGFARTRIVGGDSNASVCSQMLSDSGLKRAVDVIGLHYPSDYDHSQAKQPAEYAACHKLGKPVWASEESSSYNDLNGASCWARVVHSHYVRSGITASLMWNLVASYYHGTDWYGASMLTAVEPWSGYYEVQPVVWATAHVTHFAKPGWRYLKPGHGSGELPQGGFYTSLISPDGTDFTLHIVKISREHAQCTRPALPEDLPVSNEAVQFYLPSHAGERLALWRSDFAQFDRRAYKKEAPVLFEQQADVHVDENGRFALHVSVGEYLTVSTVRSAHKGGFPDQPIPDSDSSFPLPHVQNFDGVAVGQEAPYFVNQIGAWEVHYRDEDDGSRKVLRQMVPQTPVGWSDGGFKGPMTLLGMKEWQDVSVRVDFRLPADNVSACIGSRVDQMWVEGIVLCVKASGAWQLTLGGPPLSGFVEPHRKLASGLASTQPGVGEWHSLQMSVMDSALVAWLDDSTITSDGHIWIRPIDTGFVALGADAWAPVEYDNVRIEKTGDRWMAVSPPDRDCKGVEGGPVSVRPCQTNGLYVEDQDFVLDAQDFQIRHQPTGLCLTAAGGTQSGGLDVALAGLMLTYCTPGLQSQRFKHDYTRVRNADVPFSIKLDSSQHGHVLTGAFDGSVTLEEWDGKYHSAVPKGYSNPGWQSWSYFPNTRQLRNYYWVLNGEMGYPYCLSTCIPASDAVDPDSQLQQPQPLPAT